MKKITIILFVLFSYGTANAQRNITANVNGVDMMFIFINDYNTLQAAIKMNSKWSYGDKLPIQSKVSSEGCVYFSFTTSTGEVEMLVMCEDGSIALSTSGNIGEGTITRNRNNGL